MPRKLTTYLLGAGLTLAGHMAMAKEYAVEVIVFDRLDREVSTDEQWDFSSPRFAERLAEMAALADKTSEYEITDRVSNLDLVRLNLIESGYRILNTTGWQQPRSLYQDAPLISLGDPDTALTAGFVRIYTTTLIHADLRLQLSPPPAAPDPENSSGADPDENVDVDADADADAPPPQPHYFITEKRRLKFEEVHYFDHPLFGAIVSVRPLATSPLPE